jgi:hypothetical protein
MSEPSFPLTALKDGSKNASLRTSADLRQPEAEAEPKANSTEYVNRTLVPVSTIPFTIRAGNYSGQGLQRLLK